MKLYFTNPYSNGVNCSVLNTARDMGIFRLTNERGEPISCLGVKEHTHIVEALVQSLTLDIYICVCVCVYIYIYI